MAYKTLIFGVDDLFNELKPLYDQQIQRGILEIVAHAIPQKNGFHLVTPGGRPPGGLRDIDIAIISSHKNLYERMKLLEANGFTRNKIIDGRVFQVLNVDIERLLTEGVAYGSLINPFVDKSTCIYPRIYSDQFRTVKLDIKSYIAQAGIVGFGELSIGKFCSIANNILFQMIFHPADHNYRNVSSYSLERTDWSTPKKYYPPQDPCKILIGNDVWIGHNCSIHCNNPNKPLVIGDGAVVAAKSVVVKNVPPYAIVGGNPAQIIKYRFEPHIIEALQRIKWWDWSLDKIHDNFKYFNNIDKFIALHDK